jgi:hypothetical protein
MASKYMIKLKRKGVSVVNLLIEAGQGILNLERQSIVPTGLGTKKGQFKDMTKTH